MYMIVRMIIACAFLICSIVVIKKSKVIRKRILHIVFTGLSLLLVVVLAFFPFENLFVTFDSPKSAYEYYNNFGGSNIELVLEGDNCDFIVDRQNDSKDIYLIIPKTEDGWKIGIGLNTKRIIHKFSDKIVVCVYQYKDTSDYFITILDTNGGESTVSDEYGSEFVALESYNGALSKTFVTYYAHITEINSEYSVMVNGHKIVVAP